MLRFLPLLALLAAAAPAGGAPSTPPILYVQGRECPAHRSCGHQAAYYDRIRKIPKIGFSSHPLSSGAFSDSHPVWSPDHTRIAFVRESHNGLSYTIWVMRANGSALRALTRGNVVDTEPAWSPDGTRIVFRANSPDGKAFDLYIVPSGGGAVRNVTHNPDGVGALNPDWSPNGERIVFQRSKTGSGAGTGIFTIRPGGSGLKRLTIGGQDPAWAPNGRKIAAIFPDPRSGGQFQIYTLNANGTGRTRTTSGTESTAPAWSPGGGRIMFVRGSQIAVVGAAGGKVKQITPRLHGLAFVDTPDW
jgi:Tol biopolymer transport system component